MTNRDRITLRHILADEIDRLIAVLDLLDGDPDLEEDPAEIGIGDLDGLHEQTTLGDTDLGATGDINQERAWAMPDAPGWLVDDGEPELGWTDTESSLGRYGARDDREGDDEREGEDEREPDEDFEHDVAEGGIADADALDDITHAHACRFYERWTGEGAEIARALLAGRA